ncbi:MAG: dihydroxyacetone kinase subunit DhaK [Oscillospiraceae bacterium]|nr:dihydroxyacetone kinase subunit DhaK [Oscillospiraceae bacterium]
MQGKKTSKQEILRCLSGYVENSPERYELVLDLPAIRVKAPRETETALVIGGSEGWTEMITMMLGENLADAVICGADSAALDPNTIMRTGLAMNRGEKGILFICGNNEQEKDNFLYADSLLDEVDIRSKVAFSCQHPMEPSEGVELFLTGNMLFSVKVAGAAASCDKPLEEIDKLVRQTRNNSSGIKMYLGEKYSLRKEVEQTLFLLLNETGIRKGDTVCAFMSGFGMLGNAELNLASTYLRAGLQKKGILLHDLVLSPITQACSGAALGIALFCASDELLRYYDMPCRAQFFERAGVGAQS